MPIEATNGLASSSGMNVEPAGALRPMAASRSSVGLLLELLDGAAPVEREDAHAGGVLGVDRQGGDGDIGLAIDVRVEQLRVVHAVEVVAGEDQVVVGVVLREVPGGLAHGVGRALEPGGALRRLLGGQDLDEAVRERPSDRRRRRGG